MTDTLPRLRITPPTLDLTINVIHLIVAGTMVVTAGIWASRMEQRVAALEERARVTDPLLQDMRDRLVRMEVQSDNTAEGVRGIRQRLDGGAP
jgi:hypothetical protein